MRAWESEILVSNLRLLKKITLTGLLLRGYHDLGESVLIYRAM